MPHEPTTEISMGTTPPPNLNELEGSETDPNDQFREETLNENTNYQEPQPMHITAGAMNNIIASAVIAALSTIRVSSETNSVRIPLSDNNMQIPTFSGDRNDDDIDNWLKRVEIIRRNHQLDDATTALLATNKLLKRAKEWNNIQAELAELKWEDLKYKLKTTFRSTTDRLTLFESMQTRKWKRSERIEEYFYDKLKLLNRLNVPTEDAILHIIRGIENTILRIQLKSQQFSSTEELLLAMKSCADGLSPAPTSNPPTQAKVRKPKTPSTTPNAESSEIRCYNCNAFGHYSSSCPKPRRERGSCFTCGKQGHTFKECPQKTNSMNIALTGGGKHNQVSSIHVIIAGCKFEALVDSGSVANLMRESIAKKIQRTPEPDTQIYTGLGMTSICSLGSLRLETFINYESYYLQFSVVPDTAILHDILLGVPIFKMATVIFNCDGIQIARNH